MTDKKNKVFISYAREDYDIAKKLYDDLKSAGLCPWIDREEILVGQKWKDQIRKAIKEASFFLALLSNNSISKIGYVQKELKIAMEMLDERPDSDIFLIPAIIDDCKPDDERLSNIHWAYLCRSYKIGLNDILRAILRSDVCPSQTLSKEESLPNTQMKPPPKKLNSQFIDYCDGTILDTKTGLMWATKDNGNNISWPDAKAYCENYQGGGYNDWRMPTTDELKRLYQDAIKGKKRKIYFSKHLVWSIETKDSASANIGFFNGYNSFHHQSYAVNHRALPVRQFK